MPSFPPVGEPYATALREAVAHILERFEPCTIVAAGSIARGAPAPSSDPDVYVIRHAPARQRIQRFFAGAWAEIFVNPPEQVERYLDEEARAARPLTGYKLATGFAVHASDGCLERPPLAEAFYSRLGLPTGFLEWESEPERVQ